MYIIYFLAHCAGVTNMFPHDNLSGAVKIYRRHRRMSSNSASQKETTDLYVLLLNTEMTKAELYVSVCRRVSDCAGNELW